MNSQMQKQILIGLLSGLFVTVLIIIFLGGKRDELAGLVSQNAALQADVHKGIQLKANAEKLKVEVEQQQKIIDALIQLMPTEGDRAEIFYKMKKVADGAGIDLVETKSEAPNKSNPYYTEYPTSFKFKADYHSFGQFASLISGYDKIISVSEIQMKREPGNGIYSAMVSCRISAYVYNPEPPPAAAPTVKTPGPAKGTTKGEGE
jgi:type IV pilus assembly protein PilO